MLGKTNLMFSVKFQLLLVTAYLLAQSPGTALAGTTRFELRDIGLRNLVQVSMEGTLEKTVGISPFLFGWVEVDPERLIDGISGELRTDLRTFHTGVAAKEDFLLDKLLNVSQFPSATVTLTKLLSVSKAKLNDGQPVVAKMEGVLALKGLKKPQTFLLRLSYYKDSPITQSSLPGNLLKVSGNWDVDLTQFEIVIPANLKSQVPRYVQVAGDFVASAKPMSEPKESPKKQ